MTSGGHARSGPAPSPGSGRSDTRGLKFTTLPAEGYDGPVPEFPLPTVNRYDVYYVDKQRVKEIDPAATAQFRDTEVGHWDWAWTMPQAALWSTPQWAWVIPSIADWCRLKALSAEDDAPVGIWSAIRQREADILLTNDALLRAGFQVATDELAERRGEKPADRPLSARDRAKRLRAVGDDK